MPEAEGRGLSEAVERLHALHTTPRFHTVCGATHVPGPCVVGRSREDCLAAADALDGALHLLDDEESAQTLARLADQWRAEAETTPARGAS